MEYATVVLRESLQIAEMYGENPVQGGRRVCGARPSNGPNLLIFNVLQIEQNL